MKKTNTFIAGSRILTNKYGQLVTIALVVIIGLVITGCAGMDIVFYGDSGSSPSPSPGPGPSSNPGPDSGNVPVAAGITVSPFGQYLRKDDLCQFTAAITDASISRHGVTWKVSSNASGTGAVAPGTRMSEKGVLIIAANETLPTLYVIATSVANPTIFGSAPVYLVMPAAPPVVTPPAPVAPPAPVTPPPVVTPPAPPPPVVPTVSGVAVSPANQSVNRGRTIQFSASVAGSNNPSAAVTWKVSSNVVGTGAVTPGTGINANGLLTVSANETITTLFVIATSVVDTTKSGSVIVNVIVPAAPPVVTPPPPVTPPPVVTPPAPPPPVTPPPAPAVTSVTISPPNPTVAVGSPLRLSAAVTGANSPNTAVTWKVGSNADGTGSVGRGTSINNNGMLTISANETAAALYVVASSVADPAKFAIVKVTVIQKTTGNQNNQGQNQNNQGQNQNNQGQNKQ